MKKREKLKHHLCICGEKCCDNSSKRRISGTGSFLALQNVMNSISKQKQCEWGPWIPATSPDCWVRDLYCNGEPYDYQMFICWNRFYQEYNWWIT